MQQRKRKVRHTITIIRLQYVSCPYMPVTTKLFIQKKTFSPYKNVENRRTRKCITFT